MVGTPILTPSVMPTSPSQFLSLEQLDLIHELDEKIPELIAMLEPSNEESETLTEWCMKSKASKRYLIDTKWNLEAAVKKLNATLEWRKEYKPDQIKLEDVESEAVTGKGFISGFDKNGRPMLFIIPRLDTAKDPEKALRFLVFLIEKCIGLMPEGVEKMAVVVDYANVGFFNATPMSVAVKYLHVLQLSFGVLDGGCFDIYQTLNHRNHFPERLGVLVIMHPTLFLSGLFSVLKPLMDPVTVAKIHLVSPTTPPAALTGVETDKFDLYSIFSPDQLPVAYGGTHAFEYSHGEYWQCLQKV
ncbi:UNVERIFIED_CONTAM: hypothetical protein HDU68_007673 [Siphonaria sp. JEL0065]|nr:hypothetical protein HDU68_007673 [Siphonaria sp. JEL0065]